MVNTTNYEPEKHEAGNAANKLKKTAEGHPIPPTE